MEYEVVIALGKNWRKNKPSKRKFLNSQNPFPLSPESKLTALAAGELYESGKTDKILFSSGPTLQGYKPSEAEAMKNYMLKRYKVSEDDILLEQRSWDTSTNAEYTERILHVQQNAGLLSVGFHLKRAERLFGRFGLHTLTIASEEIVATSRNLSRARFARKYQVSRRRCQQELIESTLSYWQERFDKKGTKLRKLTRALRREE